MLFQDALQLADTVWQRRTDRKKLAQRTREVYATNLRRLVREVPLWNDKLELLPYAALVKNLNAWRKRQQTVPKLLGDRFAMIAFFDALVKQYPKNPAREVDSAPPPRRLPRPVKDRGVLEQLFSSPALQEGDGLQKNLLLDVWYHGLRKVEACRLNLQDLDVLQESIVLRVHGKGNHLREVPLVPASARRLLRHVLAHYGDPARASATFDELRRLAVPVLTAYPSRPVFLHNDERLSDREANRVFAQIRKEAQLPETLGGSAFGPHTLRHTFATDLLNEGVDLRKVQMLMGHNDIRSTQQYTFVADSALRSAVLKLRVPKGL